MEDYELSLKYGTVTQGSQKNRLVYRSAWTKELWLPLWELIKFIEYHNLIIVKLGCDLEFDEDGGKIFQLGAGLEPSGYVMMMDWF
jgi:hypothetical protein